MLQIYANPFIVTIRKFLPDMLQYFLLLATCPVLQNLQKTFETRNTLGKAETIQVSQRVVVVIGVAVVVVV